MMKHNEKYRWQPCCKNLKSIFYAENHFASMLTFFILEYESSFYKTRNMQPMQLTIFLIKCARGNLALPIFFHWMIGSTQLLICTLSVAVPTYVLPLKNRYCAKLDLVLRALDAAAFASLYNSILVPLVKLVQRELLSNRSASKPRTTHQVCRCRKISRKFSIHKVLQFLCNSLEFIQLGKTNLFNNISGQVQVKH